MERKLIDYLPRIVRNYMEFQGIIAGQQPEFEKVWDATDSMLENQFVLIAGNLGISRWEKILNITPKATDSLDDRRFRVLSRLNEELPYTLPRLRNILETLCGPGNYSAEIDDLTYTLTVKVGLSAKNNYSDVESLLDRVTPQNLIISLAQLYNTHQELGCWSHSKLALYTHNDLRNEVIT